MDWLTLGSLALWLSAITVAATNARDDDWGRRKSLGVAVFIAGAGVALFVDDVVATAGFDAAVPPGPVEIGGAAVMVVGLAVVATARWQATGEE